MINIDKKIYSKKVDYEIGRFNCLSIIMNEIEDIFLNIGYSQQWSTEIDSVINNFDNLNIPLNHPSRRKSDTFYISSDQNLLLRTHATNFQSWVMKKNIDKDIKSFSIGKVYRNDYEDSTHLSQYTNLDVICIGKEISLVNLKWTIEYFLERIFNKKLLIFWRNSFFPFTEPSFEVDINCFNCSDNQECSLCSGSGWIEILGCGMIHPKVLENNGINSSCKSGFAFGVGIERILMIKELFNDIRHIYNNNVKNLIQFKIGNK